MAEAVEIDRRLKRLERVLDQGDHLDMKAATVRMKRLEERLEKSEHTLTALMDISVALTEALTYHMARHGEADLYGSASDVIMIRKARHRLRRYADDTGLTQKARDVREARLSEGRIKPRPALELRPLRDIVRDRPTFTLPPKEIEHAER